MPKNKFLYSLMKTVDKLSRYRTTVMTMAVVVVFITTYLLILPALTLEKTEAQKQGGIDVPIAETLEDSLPDEIIDIDTDKNEEPSEDSGPDVSDDQSAGAQTDSEPELSEPGSSEFDEAQPSIIEVPLINRQDGSAETVDDPLSFKDENYKVSIVDEAGVLPEGTSISVEKIDEKDNTEEYENYYRETLSALKNEEGGERIEDIAFVSFYDISLMSDDTEIEPAEGDKVNVKIEYDKDARKDFTVEDSDNVRIVHFTEDEKTGELTAEVLDAEENNVLVDTDSRDLLQSAEFETDSFSVYAVVCTVSRISTHVITADGQSYAISVTYDDTAEIPEGAELEVREITEEDENYEEYVKRALAAGGADSSNYTGDADADTEPKQMLENGTVYQTHEVSAASDTGAAYARLFDIVISADGRKIEPKSDVYVQISLENVPDTVQSDLTVVHFGNDGDELMPLDSDPEVMNDATELSFVTDSFSVYAIASRGDGTDSNIFNNRQYVLVHNNVALSPEPNPSNTNHLRGVAVSINEDTISTTENDLPVWTIERFWDNSVNNWRYRLSTMVNGTKMYLNMQNYNGGSASVSAAPQNLLMDTQTNDHYECRFRVAESPNAALDLDYNNISSGFHAYVNGENVYFRLYELGDEIYNKVTIHFVDRNGNTINGVNYTGTDNTHVVPNGDGTYSIRYDWKGNTGDVHLDTEFSKSGYTYASSHLAGSLTAGTVLKHDGLTIGANLHSDGSSLHFLSDRGRNQRFSTTDPGNVGYFSPVDYNFNDRFRTYNNVSPYSEVTYSPAGVDKDIYVILDPTNNGSGSGGSGQGSGSGSGSGDSQGAGDVEDPGFRKQLDKNPDGTYTLSLSVTGHAKNTTEQPKANILMVVDTSSSMNGPTQGGTSTRLIDTREELKILGGQLLDKNTDYPGAVELAMISFDGDVTDELDWVSTKSEFDSCIDSNSHLVTHQGTDWEEGLKRALAIANTKKEIEPDQPVFIVFFTDGEPSQYTNFHGRATNNNGYAHWYSYFLSREAAKDEMRAIVQAGHRLYGVYAFNTYEIDNDHPDPPYNNETGSDLLHHAIQYGYDTTAILDGSYFHYATNKDALNKAFTDILRSIYSTVGFNDVIMTDSLTSLTSVGASLDGENARGFKYTRSGGPYGTGETWANAPQVTYTPATGTELASVTWKPSSSSDLQNGLEDGVTYTVSFTVWPSQEAYDYVTKLNNGFITIDQIPAEARSCFVYNETIGKYEVVTNPVSGPDGDGNVVNEIDYKKVQSETVSELPQGASTDPGNPDVVTSQEGDWPQTKTKTWYEENDDGTWTKHVTTEVVTAFNPPDKNMELEDSAFKARKQWQVNREEEMIYYLYDATTGLPVEAHKYLQFDIREVDDPDSPEDFARVVMGYDDEFGDYKWADTTHPVDVHGIVHQVGKRWEKDLDISYGLMISPDYALERGLYLEDEKYIPIYENENARLNGTVSYYILEKGHDYKIAEPALDYRFEFQTEIYHPMLVNGTPSNVKIEYSGNEYGILKEAEEESVLTGINILRGELTMCKVVIGPDGEVEPHSHAVFDFKVTLTNDSDPGPFYDDPDNLDEHNIPWYGVKVDGQGEYLYYHKTTPSEDGSYEYTDELHACVGGNYNNGLLPGYEGNRMVQTPDDNRNVVTADIRIKATDVWNITNIPSGSTYTIEEIPKKGYAFVDAEELGNSGNKVESPADSIITGGIQMNSAKEIIFRNQQWLEFDIIKVDIEDIDKENPDPLGGAAFMLEKHQDEDYRDLDTNWGLDGTKTAVEKAGEPGKFHFEGLKEGYYKLVETQWPEGYIKQGEDPKFQVIFDDDDGVFQLVLLVDDGEGGLEPAVDNRGDYIRIDTIRRPVQIETDDEDTNPEGGTEGGETITDPEPGEDEGDLGPESGESDTEEEPVIMEEVFVFTYGNTPGAVLPNAGGIGTTIFYILGTMLVLGCGIYLISRRRVLR